MWRFEVWHLFPRPTYSGKVQIKKTTCLLVSPHLLIYLLFVCAKGVVQSEAAGREAVSGPPAAGPAESPGAVHPEWAQEGWHTQEDDWVLSSVPSKIWRLKGSAARLKWTFVPCLLPVIRYTVWFFLRLFFMLFLTGIIDLCWRRCPIYAEWIISASHFIFMDWVVLFCVNGCSASNCTVDNDVTNNIWFVMNILSPSICLYRH